MSLQKIFTVAFVGLALCSCSTVRSLQHADDAQGRGTSYYLPMQIARITVERKRVPPKDFMAAKKKEAEELAKTASAAAKLKAEEVADLEKTLKELEGTPNATEAKEKVETQLKIAKADLAKLKKAETSAKGVVAIAETEISKGNFGELMDAITIAIDPSIPDRRHRYLIDLNHNMLSDDDWSIKTTPTGFLSTTDVKSTDKFPEIVVELARLAGSVSGMLLNTVNESIDQGSGDAKPYEIKEPFKFERTFDPTAYLGDVNPVVSRGACLTQGFSSLVDINKCLLALGVNLQVQVAAIRGGGSLSADDLKKETTAFQSRNILKSSKKCDDGDTEVPCVDGLVYRRPQPYAISVMTCLQKECSLDIKKQGGWVVAQSYTASLTNASPLEVMPYPRAAFVTTQNTIEFQEGVPVSVRATRPSEILEGVRIPGRALAGFGEALTQASPINVRYDNRGRDAAQAEAAYYDAQTKALQARLAYEKAQRDADALKPDGK